MIDAERKLNLKKVLSDAVLLLCVNGLGVYQSEITVEALIGITINNNEVVLISFNELMTADGGTVSRTWSQVDSPNGCSSEPDNPRKHPKSSPSKDSRNTKRKTNEDDLEKAEDLSHYDAMDVTETSCVERTECSSAELGERNSRCETTVKPWQRKHKASEKAFDGVKQQNSSNKRSLKDSSHSKTIVAEGTMQLTNLVQTEPDTKVEQSIDNSCIFVKVENSDDDDNNYSLNCTVTKRDRNYSSSVKKQPQRFTENCDLYCGTKRLTSTLTKTSPRMAQKHLRAELRTDLGQNDLEQMLNSQNVPVVEFQGNQLSTSMLGSGGSFMPSPFEQHHPELIPPTASQFAPKKRCRVCYTRKVRKEVRFCCSACPDLPGLCLSPCFYEYHEHFMSPRIFQQGIVSENGRGSMQVNRSSVSKLLPVSDTPDEMGEPVGASI